MNANKGHHFSFDKSYQQTQAGRWNQLHEAFLRLPVSVNLLPPLLVSFAGEQRRPAGCGWCRRCCDWLVARACVISCGTCSSPTPDTAWHSNIALPTHNYITTHEKSHVSLLSLYTVNRQVMLQRRKFLTLSH